MSFLSKPDYEQTIINITNFDKNKIVQLNQEKLKIALQITGVKIAQSATLAEQIFQRILNKIIDNSQENLNNLENEKKEQNLIEKTNFQQIDEKIKKQQDNLQNQQKKLENLGQDYQQLQKKDLEYQKNCASCQNQNSDIELEYKHYQQNYQQIQTEKQQQQLNQNLLQNGYQDGDNDIQNQQLTKLQITEKNFKQIVGEQMILKGYQQNKALYYYQRILLACEIIDKKCPLIILLGGTSGTGKSTAGSILAARFGISTVLSTDTIRQILRNFMDEKDYPPLFISTYQAGTAVKKEYFQEDSKFYQNYKHIIDQFDITPDKIDTMTDKEKALKGYKMQCEVVQERLFNVIKEYSKTREPIVIEGVHLTPQFMIKIMKNFENVIPFTICIKDEKKHQERFAVRSKYMTLDKNHNKYIKNFHNIRLIQKWFLEKAGQYLIPQINNVNIDKSLGIIHKTILKYHRKLSKNSIKFKELKNAFPLYEQYNKTTKKYLSSQQIKEFLQQKVTDPQVNINRYLDDISDFREHIKNQEDESQYLVQSEPPKNKQQLTQIQNINQKKSQNQLVLAERENIHKSKLNNLQKQTQNNAKCCFIDEFGNRVTNNDLDNKLNSSNNSKKIPLKKKQFSQDSPQKLKNYINEEKQLDGKMSDDNWNKNCNSNTNLIVEQDYKQGLSLTDQEIQSIEENQHSGEEDNDLPKQDIKNKLPLNHSTDNQKYRHFQYDKIYINMNENLTKSVEIYKTPSQYLLKNDDKKQNNSAKKNPQRQASNKQGYRINFLSLSGKNGKSRKLVKTISEYKLKFSDIQTQKTIKPQQALSILNKEGIFKAKIDSKTTLQQLKKLIQMNKLLVKIIHLNDGIIVKKLDPQQVNQELGNLKNEDLRSSGLQKLSRNNSENHDMSDHLSIDSNQNTSICIGLDYTNYELQDINYEHLKNDKSVDDQGDRIDEDFEFDYDYEITDNQILEENGNSSELEEEQSEDSSSDDDANLTSKENLMERGLDENDEEDENENDIEDYEQNENNENSNIINQQMQKLKVNSDFSLNQNKMDSIYKQNGEQQMKDDQQRKEKLMVLSDNVLIQQKKH